MSKVLFFISSLVLVVGLAYYSAQDKLSQKSNLQALRLGMTSQEIETHFGVPTAQNRNELVYILEDSSELTITLRDNVVTSAKVKFRTPMTVSHPKLKELTLVQMDPTETFSGQPNWFFAGKPEEGLIYKISSEGVVESMTWVPPFSYPHHRPKNVQVLLRDFKSREFSQL